MHFMSGARSPEPKLSQSCKRHKLTLTLIKKATCNVARKLPNANDEHCKEHHCQCATNTHRDYHTHNTTTTGQSATKMVCGYNMFLPMTQTSQQHFTMAVLITSRLKTSNCPCDHSQELVAKHDSVHSVGTPPWTCCRSRILSLVLSVCVSCSALH